ncbi:hypothetical protein V1634_11925 [Plantactinospora veratri]|uniref:Uncharacterized protein n=1 Tax=Plantactinospora veratri TaxID=1436122 RepID=A0ABU7SC69_9ACTN
MSRRHRKPVRHYRAWYFLWIFCSCGRRWRCPRTIAAPRRPGPPPTGRPALVRVPPDPPPPPARSRHANTRPAWAAPTRPHRANSRAGGPTPDRAGRARLVEFQ